MRFPVRRVGRPVARPVRGVRPLLGLSGNALDFLTSDNVTVDEHGKSTYSAAAVSTSGSGSLTDAILKVGAGLASNALGPKPAYPMYYPQQSSISPTVLIVGGVLLLGGIFILMKD